MSDATHDVIVIGGGPGGYAAALYGASSGLDVAVVEHYKVGGTCLHVGCIPAKELLEAASVYRTVAGAAEFGVTASEPGIDWSAVLGRKQRVIDQLTAGLSGLLGQRKVTVYSGSGSLGGPGAVEVVPAGGGPGAVEVVPGRLRWSPPAAGPRLPRPPRRSSWPRGRRPARSAASRWTAASW